MRRARGGIIASAECGATARPELLQRRYQASATRRQIIMIGVRRTFVFGPRAVGLNRKFALALRAESHVSCQRGRDAHDGGA